MIMFFIYLYLLIGVAIASCMTSFIYHQDFWSKGMSDDVKKQMDNFREGYTEHNPILIIILIYVYNI